MLIMQTLYTMDHRLQCWYNNRLSILWITDYNVDSNEGFPYYEAPGYNVDSNVDFPYYGSHEYNVDNVDFPYYGSPGYNVENSVGFP